MSLRLILIGGGEHARVVAEAVRSAGTAELWGFVDPEPCAETVRRLGLERLGDEGVLDRLHAHGVVAIAALTNRDLRPNLVQRLGSRMAGWATVVHRSAWVSPTASIGEGTVVMAGAVVQTGARIGAHCIINSGAVVEHDVEIGDFGHVSSGAVVGGGARLGPNCHLGLGAGVRDHVSIGAGVVVGMGAVVVADISEGRQVMGVPAR